ncbi:hypothetical protein [Thioalkalivibrio sp.]|uniref:hypothetical protein n=1 Tax=Thioalkalivibrio sp. TaxID=2093813 RepID=UPI0035692B12
MAIRVGTTAHDQGGIRVSTTAHEPFTDALLTGVSPETLRPGATATLTVDDSSAVDLVAFAGDSMTFAVASATTVTFEVPDGYLYGDRPIRAEDSGGAGRTINHPYQPAAGNLYATLADYPPGLNVFGTQQLHLGEDYYPAPVDGDQIEVWTSDPAYDPQINADGTYSVADPAYLQRRLITDDGTATDWEDVYVNLIPDTGDAMATGDITSVSLGAPTGRASLGLTYGGSVAEILLTAPTGSVDLVSIVNASGSIAPVTLSSISGNNTRTVQWDTITTPSSNWERQ